MNGYRLLLVVGIITGLALPGHSLGIAMRFTDVTLENVEPGASFNLRVIRNLPLVVINQDPVHGADIMVESQIPTDKEMKEGYEPIPDSSWIQVLPTKFHLGPKASASVDVIVNVPTDPKYIGHHYEAILWVHTDANKNALRGGGVLIQAGLRSRFRMSIGTMGPASLQREKKLKKLATINTNFTVNPDSIFVQTIPLGKPIDLRAEKRASLKVVNQSDDPIKLKFQPIESDPNIIPQGDYVYAPDFKWLTVNPQVLLIPGNSIKEIKLTLNIPDQPENRNKKFAFLIRTTLADDDLPLAYNNVLYVTTEP
jgi:hypothetical protein